MPVTQCRMARDGGWFDYFTDNRVVLRRSGHPGQIRHYLRDQLGFQSANLNFAGWTAGLAPGLSAGAAVALTSNLPLVPVALSGMALSWTLALVIDRVVWRNLTFGITVEDLAETQIQTIARSLRSQGIPIEIEESIECGSSTPQWTFHSTNRHLGPVKAALEHQRD